MRLLKVAGRILGVVAVVLVVIIAIGIAQYGFKYVSRVLIWQDSDFGDYMNHFPQRKLLAAPTPYTFDEAPDEARVTSIFKKVLQVESFDPFMEESTTQAFIVIKDGAVAYEHYFNGTQRDSLLTSFSMAKSFVTALVGIAVDEGAIGSIEDPITGYLPELGERDPRFGEITIKDLMMMAAGMDYKAFRPTIWNSDDMLTTYYPDQRKAALEFTEILDPPGEYFKYNKYYPQLLGLILERTTRMTITDFMQVRLWNPLGMEYGGSWSLDSKESGFEKMESGVNARAIDFAKFGQLYLNGGKWNGVQVISSKWVADSTQVDPATHNASYYAVDGQTLYGKLNGYYSYMWWGMLRGEEGYDFAARGDHGQFIYVAPSKDLVIVRLGYEWGFPGSDTEAGAVWMRAMHDFVTEY
jgi:CubicO group peptidase (beta-lactamase class C family)